MSQTMTLVSLTLMYMGLGVKIQNEDLVDLDAAVSALMLLGVC